MRRRLSLCQDVPSACSFFAEPLADWGARAATQELLTRVPAVAAWALAGCQQNVGGDSDEHTASDLWYLAEQRSGPQ